MNNEKPTEGVIADENTTIKAICRVMAQIYRQGGTDPKTIPPTKAWTDYALMCEQGLRLQGNWNSTPQEYKDFLQSDSPQSAKFRAQWEAMSRENLLEGTDIWIPPSGDVRRN